jgi:AraC-like DNA-binding protein
MAVKLEPVVTSPAERDAARMQANCEELVERIARAVPKDGSVQPLEGLYLFRISLPLGQVHSLVKPSFCVIAQGSKEILLGGSRYRYDPSHYLITTVELPRASQILDVSPERPYLGLRLELDPTLVGSVMMETGQTARPNQADVRAIDVSALDVNLQDAVLRLVRLLDSTPKRADAAEADASDSAVPVLMPLIKREIIYRLLMGQQGARLRHLAVMGGNTSFISRAVERLRQDFDQPIHMEDLARELGMSVSGLHHHFKAVTAMSPLQFLKQLRLQEARRLMLSENMDAASAAFRVGYHDPSHFNREYKSLFGVPPIRDVRQLRGDALESADQWHA